MSEEKAVYLELTSAIAMDGAVCKAGEIIAVTETEARNLLDRGKATLAVGVDTAATPTADQEAPALELVAEPDADAEAAADEEPVAKSKARK